MTDPVERSAAQLRAGRILRGVIRTTIVLFALSIVVAGVALVIGGLAGFDARPVAFGCVIAAVIFLAPSWIVMLITSRYDFDITGRISAWLDPYLYGPNERTPGPTPVPERESRIERERRAILKRAETRRASRDED